MWKLKQISLNNSEVIKRRKHVGVVMNVIKRGQENT